MAKVIQPKASAQVREPLKPKSNFSNLHICSFLTVSYKYIMLCFHYGSFWLSELKKNLIRGKKKISVQQFLQFRITAFIALRTVHFKKVKISKGKRKKPQGHWKVFICPSWKKSFYQNCQHTNLLWEPNTFAELWIKDRGAVILNEDDSLLLHPQISAQISIRIKRSAPALDTMTIETLFNSFFKMIPTMEKEPMHKNINYP